MQAAKRNCNAPSTSYLNIWLCGRQTDLNVMGVRVGVANFFGSSDRYWRDLYITVKIFFQHENCRHLNFGRVWEGVVPCWNKLALRKKLRNLHKNLNFLAFVVFEISTFIRTDRQTDMARSTWLVVLMKNIHNLWGRKRFLLPVTYSPTNIIPFYSTSNMYKKFAHIF